MSKRAAVKIPPGGLPDHAIIGAQEYQFHKYANAFPLIEGEEFFSLVARMRANGFAHRHPIVLYEGQILDGRNRYRAALAAGVKPEFRAYNSASDGAPIDFVIAENIDRRHLTASQRAYAVTEFETFRHGGARRGPAASDAGPTRAEQAQLFGVSERSVARAAIVRDAGAPALRDAVKAGAVPVTIAAQLAGALAKGEQEKLAALGERAILQAAAEIRRRKSEAKRAERIARIVVIAAGARELDLARRYPVLYVDPPWQYENPHMGTTGRSIENHYPTMPLEDICALPVRELALPDAVLFMWITVPHTYCSGPAVLDAWGFSFRSEVVWDKEVPGTGYWTRGRHEKLMICVRGNIPPPHGSDRVPPSLYRERRGDHSVKPDYFPGMIERMYPEFVVAPPGDPLLIELFARTEIFDAAGNVIGRKPVRPGWAVWGNQAGAGEAQAA